MSAPLASPVQQGAIAVPKAEQRIQRVSRILAEHFEAPDVGSTTCMSAAVYLRQSSTASAINEIACLSDDEVSPPRQAFMLFEEQ